MLLFFLVMMSRVRDAESHWTMVGYIPLVVAAGGLLDERSAPFPAWLRCYIAACLAVAVVGIAGFYAHSQDPALRRLLPAGRTTPTGTSSTRCTAGPSSAMRSPRRRPRSDRARWWRAASTRCARTSSPPSTTVPVVYCPGPRRTEFDFLGRRDPPPGVPVLYIDDDHYREDPGALLPDRDCAPLRTVSVERDGVFMQNYHFWACSPRAQVAR